MSVINKMLQDLDRRQAISDAENIQAPKHVRTVSDSSGHEWFWRITGALLLAAIGWVGWVVYQLQPRAIATEIAFKAADQRARAQIAVKEPAPVVAEKPAAASPQVTAAVAGPAPVTAAPSTANPSITVP